VREKDERNVTNVDSAVARTVPQGAVGRELHDEPRSHLEMHIEENVRRGMTAGVFAAGERSAPGKLHSSAARFAGGSDDRVAVRVR
jgi:hypothetical protein